MVSPKRAWDFARRREAVLARNPELQERDLIKMVAWSASLADALRCQGVTASNASLVGEVAVAAFRVAFQTWIGSSRRRKLTELIEESFNGLREVTAQRRS